MRVSNFAFKKNLFGGFQRENKISKCHPKVFVTAQNAARGVSRNLQIVVLCWTFQNSPTTPPAPRLSSTPECLPALPALLPIFQIHGENHVYQYDYSDLCFPEYLLFFVALPVYLSALPEVFFFAPRGGSGRHPGNLWKAFFFAAKPLPSSVRSMKAPAGWTVRHDICFALLGAAFGNSWKIRLGEETRWPNSSVSSSQPPPSFFFDSASTGVRSAATRARCLWTASSSARRRCRLSSQGAWKASPLSGSARW